MNVTVAIVIANPFFCNLSYWTLTLFTDFQGLNLEKMGKIGASVSLLSSIAPSANSPLLYKGL